MPPITGAAADATTAESAARFAVVQEHRRSVAFVACERVAVAEFDVRFV